MKKGLVIIALFFSFILSGCTFHCTKGISEKLDIDALNKSYNVVPTDLSLLSECEKPPTVNIVNIETRVEDFEALQNPPTYGFINPKEMMDSVKSYLDQAFKQSKINIDDKSNKVIQIKMVDLKSTAGVWSFGSYFKMGLTILDTGFKKEYESRDNAFGGYTAAAYAIHTVVRQVIDDTLVQNYLLCKSGKSNQKDDPKTLSHKLLDLKNALDGGFITNDEYQIKRKMILENH